jgi:transcription elongation factor GreA-like protein
MLSLSKVINARLLKQLKTITETQTPWDKFVDIEQAHGRITCRIVKVFTELKNIDLDWVGVQSLKQARTHWHPLRKKIFTN